MGKTKTTSKTVGYETIEIKLKEINAYAGREVIA